MNSTKGKRNKLTHMKKDVQAAFHEAVMNGDKQKVQALLRQGADVNSPNVICYKDGRRAVTPALTYAAFSGDAEMLQVLLDAGADVNARDDEGSTALLECVMVYAPCVELLLKAGADVNARDCENNTALMFASIDGNPEIVKMLLEAGAHVNVHGDDSNETPYALARFEANNMDNEGAAECLPLLLKAGALEHVLLDIEDDETLMAVNYEFLKAVQHQDVERMKAALLNGADINAADRFGTTALDQAARYHNAELCRELLVAGMSQQNIVNAFDWLWQDDAELYTLLLSQTDEENRPLAGYRAMCNAAVRGNVNAVKALLELKVSPDAPHTGWQTPLMKLAKWHNSQRETIMELLLHAGADINAVDEKGWSATAYAVHRGWVNGVRRLLQAGASATLVQDGKTVHVSQFAPPCYEKQMKEVCHDSTLLS